jgi:cytochrome c-type biogenesis protein
VGPGDRQSARAVLRALGVGGALTGGFVLVFGLVGMAWSSLAAVVGPRLPWVTVVMGVGIVILGVAMLAGFEPVLRLPHWQPDTTGGDTASAFIFGVSYAIASLSCTAPIFAGLLSATFSESFTSGLVTFVAFAMGMGALITLLTVSVALAREGLIRTLRRVIPHLGRVSGGLLVVTGLVVAYYGWAEARQLSGETGGTGLADRLQRWQANLAEDVTRFVDRVGAGWLALGVAVLLSGIAVLSYRRAHRSELAGTAEERR